MRLSPKRLLLLAPFAALRYDELFDTQLAAPAQARPQAPKRSRAFGALNADDMHTIDPEQAIIKALTPVQQLLRAGEPPVAENVPDYLPLDLNPSTLRRDEKTGVELHTVQQLEATPQQLALRQMALKLLNSEYELQRSRHALLTSFFEILPAGPMFPQRNGVIICLRSKVESLQLMLLLEILERAPMENSDLEFRGQLRKLIEHGFVSTDGLNLVPTSSAVKELIDFEITYADCMEKVLRDTKKDFSRARGNRGVKFYRSRGA